MNLSTRKNTSNVSPFFYTLIFNFPMLVKGMFQTSFELYICYVVRVLCLLWFVVFACFVCVDDEL